MLHCSISCSYFNSREKNTILSTNRVNGSLFVIQMFWKITFQKQLISFPTTCISFSQKALKATQLRIVVKPRFLGSTEPRFAARYCCRTMCSLLTRLILICTAFVLCNSKPHQSARFLLAKPQADKRSSTYQLPWINFQLETRPNAVISDTFRQICPS